MTARELDAAVIVAAYNAGATLDRAVESALAQPEVVELCIVDDGSGDDTAAKAEAWARRDARVVVRALQENVGPAAARNAAIAATTAPWIVLLDADDYLLPGRLGALLGLAGDADFIADGLIRMREGERPPRPALERLCPRPLSFAAFVGGNLGRAGGPLDLGFLKPAFRRAFLNAKALRYREELRLGEDYEFYARALALGARFLVCPPAGYVSVEREGSLSRAHSIADLQRLRDCDDALAALRPLSREEKSALARHWTSVDCRLQWRRLIDAVKARDPAAAIATFHTPAAATYLAARLAEQIWLRGAASASRRLPPRRRQGSAV